MTSDDGTPRCFVVSQVNWSAGKWGLAIVTERCDALFARLGLPVRKWEEDGLGDARGGLVCLPSGRIFLVEELSHAIEHLGIPGPYVWADARDVTKLGIDKLLDELTEGFSLQRAQLWWTQSPDSRP